METKRLAVRIRAFRKLKRYTQLEMAERLGISLSTLGSIERGTKKVDDRLLHRISELLQVPIAELAKVSGEEGLNRWD